MDVNFSQAEGTSNSLDLTNLSKTSSKRDSGYYSLKNGIECDKKQNKRDRKSEKDDKKMTWKERIDCEGGQLDRILSTPNEKDQNLIANIEYPKNFSKEQIQHFKAQMKDLSIPECISESDFYNNGVENNDEIFENDDYKETETDFIKVINSKVSEISIPKATEPLPLNKDFTTQLSNQKTKEIQVIFSII